MRTVSIAAAALTLAACGTEERELDVNVHLPFFSPITCTMRSELSTMTAAVRIGGHQDCQLAVNMTSLEASGRCERITIGIVRPLMIVYEIPPPPPGTQPTAQLAFHVGWVDLEKEAIPADATIIPVNLGTDNLTGSLVIREGELDDNISAAMAGDMKDALEWAKSQVTEQNDTLDRDLDMCSNLEEICARGLNELYMTNTYMCM